MKSIPPQASTLDSSIWNISSSSQARRSCAMFTQISNVVLFGAKVTVWYLGGLSPMTAPLGTEVKSSSSIWGRIESGYAVCVAAPWVIHSNE